MPNKRTRGKAPDSDVRPIAIFDLDGTLCNIDHRLGAISEEPKDWDRFYEACSFDKPLWTMIALLRQFEPTHYIAIWTGRSAQVREKTEYWLARHVVPYDELQMRRSDDRRPDYILKKEWLESCSKHYYRRIHFVVEDRARVARMYREHQIMVLQCADGEF